MMQPYAVSAVYNGPIPDRETSRPYAASYILAAMSSLQIVTSLANKSTFSIEEALGNYSSLGTLFESGCLVNGISNCTAACQDPNLIFASPYTLQNCMVMVALGNTTVSYYNMTLSDPVIANASKLSIYPKSSDYSSLISTVNQTIEKCFTQYCNQSPGGCPISGDGPVCQWFSAREIDGSSLVTSDICFPNICGNVPAQLNADIGGIGVRHRVIKSRS